MLAYEWHPIEDLPDELMTAGDPDLQALALAWQERLEQLKESRRLVEFNQRLSRQWAIETGILERVYSLDRGITQILIEKGIEASLIPHGTSSKPAGLVVSIIQDQKEVIDGLFDFVAQRRNLSTSYIKQMHQVFMRNQPTTEGLDEFGHFVEIEVRRGDWKKWPNNPSRPGGRIHQYCPPEQVASEMDRLIILHEQHLQAGVHPETEAAWLHHRFTQIHPFQDGNGRVARALATLGLLRAGRFPLVIANEQRSAYIEACERADLGDLRPLIALFVRQQIHAFRQALAIAEDVAIPQSIEAVIQQSLDKLRQRRIPSNAFDISRQLEAFARQRLQEIASNLSNALQQIEPNYQTAVLCSDPDTDFWFKGQVIQMAQKFQYYANFRNYRAWVQLKIKEQRLSHLVLSFHGLGYEFSGIMAVSAFLEFRSGLENDEALPEGPYPVNTDIFQFSYRDEPALVIERFKPWLEDTLLIGLEQWRKQL